MSVTSQWMVHKVANDYGVDYDHLTGNVSSSDPCVTNHSDPVFILKEQIQSDAAKWTMYLSMVGFVPGLLARLFLSSLADRYGRKLLFTLPCIGSIFSVVLYMCIIGFNLPIW